MFPHVIFSGGRAVSSAVTAIVVAAGLVVVAPEPTCTPTEIHRVQLSAAVLSAAEHSSTVEAAAATVSTTAEAPTAVAARQASAAVDTTFWSTPLGTVLIAVNLAVLPIWFLLTPITLPLSMFASAAVVPQNSGSLGSLLFLAGTGIIFLTGPLGALNAIVNGISARSSASATASGRNSAAATVPASAAIDSSPATDGPAAEQHADSRTILTDTRPRARAAARQAGEAPRAAAAVAPGRSAAEAVSAGRDAELRNSSSADDSNGKAKARAKMRR